MPAPPTKNHLGYLKTITWWIESGAIKEPFWVEYRHGDARFHPHTYYSTGQYWPHVFSDLEDRVNAGYLYMFEIDNTNWYELTPTGKQTGAWTTNSPMY
jgi:hypothetical protein